MGPNRWLGVAEAISPGALEPVSTWQLVGFGSVVRYGWAMFGIVAMWVSLLCHRC